MSVKNVRKMISIMLMIVVLFAGYQVWIFSEDQESASVGSDVDSTLLIPGGMPIGIYLETDGVMVSGTEKIKNASGIYEEPAKNLVKEGDYIVAVNGKNVENKEKMIEYLKKASNNIVNLRVRRKAEYINVNVKPVMNKEGEYKLGIWIKDDTQGLGTVTFLTSDSKFGALGHGIIDSETEEVLQISGGTLYETSIQNIVKGKNGYPGGVEGVIIYNRYNVIGKITKNNETGIYGEIDKIKRVFDDTKAYPAASKKEIKPGKAYIRSAVDGSVRDYEVVIKKINQNAREVNKGIEIQVTDERLLNLTGGIIQGMSGSPIMQNGKIVGAVTHVFVQDSTRGYGIFIENMLENVAE